MENVKWKIPQTGQVENVIQRFKDSKIQKFSPLERGRGVLLLLFALCAMPFAHAQVYNGITNDGTTAARWQVGDDSLGWMSVGLSPDIAPNNNFDLMDGFTMGSHTFAAGWQVPAGWQLNYDDSIGYTYTVDNLVVRGTLSAYELLLNQLRAVNGNQIVSSAAVVDTGRYVDYVNSRFVVEDVTGHNLPPFAAGDIIMCQRANISGVTYDGSGDINNNAYLIKRLVYKVDSTGSGGNNPLRVYYSTLAGAPANKGFPQKGDTFIRIGSVSNSARRGAVGIYSDEQYAPYIRITADVDGWSDWKSVNSIKAQVGRLDGITDADFGALSGYGIYTDNGYFKGKIKMTNQSSIQISGFNNDAGYVNHDYIGAQTYYSASAPGSPATGDFWFDTSISGSYIMKRWNGSTWQAVGVYMDASGVYTSSLAAGQITSGEINVARLPALSAMNNDANYIKTYYQASAPTGTIPEGSIWIESDQFNSIYRYESSTWVEKVGVGTGLGTYIDGTGIYTGVLNATQINAGTINADRIAAGSITYDKMSVANLSAISADLGTITGGTITGATIQTSTSYPRVKIDNSEVIHFQRSAGSEHSIGNSAGNLLVSSPTEVNINSSDVNVTSFGFSYNGNEIATESSVNARIGSTVQAYDADLDDLADGSLTGSKVGTGISAANITTGTLANARLGGSTVTFNGIYELSSGNWYQVNYTNGLLSSYSNYGVGDTYTGTIYVSTNGTSFNQQLYVYRGIIMYP